MVAEAVEDHLRQEVRPEQTLVEYALWTGRHDHVALAAPAGVLLPRDLVHVAHFDALDLVGRDLADLRAARRIGQARWRRRSSTGALARRWSGTRYAACALACELI
jgi:hypothetical protein